MENKILMLLCIVVVILFYLLFEVKEVNRKALVDKKFLFILFFVNLVMAVCIYGVKQCLDFHVIVLMKYLEINFTI